MGSDLSLLRCYGFTVSVLVANVNIDNKCNGYNNGNKHSNIKHC